MAGATLSPKCKICGEQHQGPLCPKFYGSPKIRVMSEAETKAARAAQKPLLLAAPAPAAKPPKKKNST